MTAETRTYPKETIISKGLYYKDSPRKPFELQPMIMLAAFTMQCKRRRTPKSLNCALIAADLAGEKIWPERGRNSEAGGRLFLDDGSRLRDDDGWLRTMSIFEIQRR